MQNLPPYRKALVPALIEFICRFWTQPQMTSRPINFGELK